MQANTDPRYPAPIEFIVDTKDKRHLRYSAISYESLIRDLHFDGHTPTFIMPLSEYEAKQNGVTQERELKESA